MLRLLLPLIVALTEAAAVAADARPHLPLVLKRDQPHDQGQHSNDSATDIYDLVQRPPTDVAAWNLDTDAACVAALLRLREASNPTGASVCYNIAGLDPGAGTFVADLRLYRVSPPRDEFVDVPEEALRIAVAFGSATARVVDPSGSSSPSFGDEDGSGGSRERVSGPVGQKSSSPLSSSPVEKRATKPRLLRTYMYNGLVDSDAMVTNGPMTIATLETLLIPEVFLTAVTSELGETKRVSLSTSEASFVSGVFSDTVVLSAAARAQLAVDEAVAALANGTEVFQMPGMHLLIFPYSVVAVSVWTLLFLTIIGLGTFQRWSHRRRFRRWQMSRSPGDLDRLKM